MAAKIFSSQPVFIAFGLEPADKSLHRNLHHILTAVTLTRALSIFDPPLRGKVRALSAIEPVIKTSVITEGKRDHNFTGLLCYLIERNIVLAQHLGRDECHLMTQERWTFSEMFSERHVGELLQLATLCWWDCIPSFRGS